ncbi:MAG: hypothetical protein GQ476_03305 [Candidatus Aminicenantes bacterium]|nr:hypothetical protein [Candidatus Aminicenantes bacterium]
MNSRAIPFPIAPTAVVVAIDEWERIQKAKNLLEHVYLAGIIEDRRHSKPTVRIRVKAQKDE